MKPASLAAMLDAQADVVEVGGGRRVAGQLRDLARFFREQKAGSVATAMKGVPTGSRPPADAADLLFVLDATAETHRAVSAKSAALADLKTLRAALGCGVGTVGDAIAAWTAATARPAPRKSSTRSAGGKPKVDTAELVGEYASALRGAHYDTALPTIERMAADKRLKTTDLKAILAAVHERSAGKATKANLIDMIKRPFLDRRIRDEKSRAIRAGGAL